MVFLSTSVHFGLRKTRDFVTQKFCVWEAAWDNGCELIGMLTNRWYLQFQRAVSLTLRELSKIFSRNRCIVEIVLLLRISSWNFEIVPKALLWAHVQICSLKFASEVWYLSLCIFVRLFLQSSRNVSETTPDPLIIPFDGAVVVNSDRKVTWLHKQYLSVLWHSLIKRVNRNLERAPKSSQHAWRY